MALRAAPVIAGNSGRAPDTKVAMRIFVPAVLISALVLAPAAAEAQAVRVARAELRAGRAGAGTLAGATVEIVRWESARRARVRFEDPSIAIEASIDVRDGSTRVLLGTGEDVAIAGGPWAITMLAGSWAPLVGRGEDDRPRVLLPEGLPMRRGTLGRRVRAPDAAPSYAFDHAMPDWAEWSPSCRAVTLHASPDPGAPRWRIPPGSVVRIAGARAPFAIDAWIEGFAVRGYADVRPAPCGGGMAARTALGRGCVGAPRGELRVVPAGTVIHAGGVPVATLRIDAVGIVSSDEIQVTHTVPSGASWSIHGTIDAPLDSLAVASEAPEDTSFCVTAIEWPEG